MSIKVMIHDAANNY